MFIYTQVINISKHSNCVAKNIDFIAAPHKWKVIYIIQEAEYQTIFIVYSIGTTNNVQIKNKKSGISANATLQI